ncbi:hypothetical protein [Planctomicrobium sp. SH527]|uniref:hypothetical protein n=1 Tax=Planctomicrobium sp. SH527 TaxID=3448123 RepID=UPI003F5B2F8D
MSIEWTPLDQLESLGFDTPELEAAREECNAEIAGIHDEREQIDLALNVIRDTPVDQLTVQQIAKAREAKERNFEVLKRELRLRRGGLSNYYDTLRRAALHAAGEQELVANNIEAEVIAGIEKLGFEKQSPKWALGYDDAFLRRNRRVFDSRQRRDHLQDFSRNYQASRDNNSVADTLNHALDVAMRQLVGVSNGIGVSQAPRNILSNGIG